MRAINVTDHFRSPEAEREARLDWLSRHGYDPADVDLIMELRPGQFQVRLWLRHEDGRPIVENGELQHRMAEFISEWPCPGLLAA